MNQPGFDHTYKDVPAAQKQMLLDFRARHPYQELAINGARRRYIACGQGEKTLLFLHGGFVRPDMWFHAILALENDYRILAPDLSKTFGIAEVSATLWGALEAENVDKATVIGISAGGGTAQYAVQEYPDRVEHLVLSHCGPLRADWVRRGRRMVRLLTILPLPVIWAILRRRSASYPPSSQWAAFTRAYFREVTATLDKQTFIRFCEAGIVTSQGFAFKPAVIEAWHGDVLIMSTKDDESTFAGVAELEARFPRARTHIFEEGGHHAFMLFPEAYLAVLKGFLDDVLA